MKTYKILLEVLTPVYIGNGNNISKKDFTIERGIVHVYDPIKVYKIIGSRYENFLTNNESLSAFVKNNRLNIKDAIKYSVPLGDEIRLSDSINEFIKDPYSIPYVPGSSLKGALRTAILSTLVAQQKKAISYEPLYKGANELEKKIFGSFNDSRFKYFKISDSKPLSFSDLLVCKKIDVFLGGKENTKLNLCREALKPGTKIEFKLGISEGIGENGKKLWPWTPDQIMKTLRNFAIKYERDYVKNFGIPITQKYGANIVFIGGGTGFLTKTINNDLYGKEKALTEISNYLSRNFKNHGHDKDIDIGVSPRAMKCTSLDGKILPMGICNIRFEEYEAI